MRDLYRKFLYIPRNAKMTDKAFLGRITVSVAVMLISMAAMAFSAYAYFADSVLSSTNTLVAAKYDLDWTVTLNGEKRIKTGITLPAGSTVPADYHIAFTQSNNSTASTGFAILSVDFNDDGTVDEVYHTAQIGDDVNAPDGVREGQEFTIRLNQPARITITPHWGTSTAYTMTTFSLRSSGVRYIPAGTTMIEIGELPPAETPEPSTPSTSTNTQTTESTTATTDSTAVPSESTTTVTVPAAPTTTPETTTTASTDAAVGETTAPSSESSVTPETTTSTGTTTAPSVVENITP